MNFLCRIVFCIVFFVLAMYSAFAQEQEDPVFGGAASAFASRLADDREPSLKTALLREALMLGGEIEGIVREGRDSALVNDYDDLEWNFNILDVPLGDEEKAAVSDLVAAFAGNDSALREFAYRRAYELAVNVKQSPQMIVDPLDFSVPYQSALEKFSEEIASRFQTYVYRGPLAQSSELTSVVALVSDGNRLCSGVLIGDREVVTAAHCICDRDDKGQQVGKFTHVVFGTSRNSSIRKEIDWSGTRAAAACPAHGYPTAKEYAPRDVGIVKLRQNAPDTFRRARVAADRETVAAGETILIAGFGKNDRDDPGKKRYAQIRVTTPDCSGSLNLFGKEHSESEHYGCLDGVELVAEARRTSPDSCFGDSGGPVFLTSPTSLVSPDESLPVIAVISRNAKHSSTVCGAGTIYARVSASVISDLRSSPLASVSP